MNELEKIAYAKTFIDKLANGINPLDDTQVPDEDIINNVHVSRCFFYVSEILQEEMNRTYKKLTKKPRKQKSNLPPFYITPEQLQNFEYSTNPISVTAVTRKINWLVKKDIEERKMESLSYQKILQWLLNIGMIEYREWEGGKMKRFPTEEGKAIGLVLGEWEKYGNSSPVIYYSEEAQRFIIDNIECVIATEVKKSKRAFLGAINYTQEGD